MRAAARCNPLDNAVKYGGRHIVLDVQAGVGGGWRRVDDDGPGIPPEQRERVSDCFQRGEAREVEAAGLAGHRGRRVARRHGARIALADRCAAACAGAKSAAGAGPRYLTLAEPEVVCVNAAP